MLIEALRLLIARQALEIRNGGINRLRSVKEKKTLAGMRIRIQQSPFSL